jgi:hypothetical protein
MKFQMPSAEELAKLSKDEVDALYEKALAEATELNSIPDDKITDEEAAALIELHGNLGTLADRSEELEAAEKPGKPDADALAAARAGLPKADDKADEKPEDKGGDDKGGEAPKGDGDKAGEEPKGEKEAEKVEEKELAGVGASGAPAGRTQPRSFSSKQEKAGKSTEEAISDIVEKSEALSIIASANVPGFNTQQELKGFDELAVAYVNRGKAFAGGGRAGRRGAKSLEGSKFNGGVLTTQAQRYGVAKLEKPENEFTITEKMSAEDQYDLIMAASKEKRLGGGSLVAAGGWCSPSEQIYGFLELESADGLLSISEINSRRGGIQYTKGPQLADLLLDVELGFTQTEAQAEAGDVKPVFDIDCPDWDEVRMDAVGYAIRAGLLTNTTYPELVRRYLALGLIVHARRMNRLTIQRLQALITTARTFAPVNGTAYSSTADLLSAIELNALEIRERYSMPLNSTVEAVFPLWVHAVIRSELSRRPGSLDVLNVTDAQINAWFAQRKINPQFVRDYQGINTGAANTAGGTAAFTRFPDKVEFMLYPAGSFVRLATDVIDLDTVYDTDDLTKNQFMAAFFEEGFAIANTGGSGVKVTVNLNNLNGATGYPAIGSGVGVSFAPAA